MDLMKNNLIEMNIFLLKFLMSRSLEEYKNNGFLLLIYMLNIILVVTTNFDFSLDNISS